MGAYQLTYHPNGRCPPSRPEMGAYISFIDPDAQRPFKTESYDIVSGIDTTEVFWSPGY
jgi:hypothetical protein